ncbi:MAG: TolC family protein, partial [Spirochaetota bacterium]|nr:TolC family protein [Spirochaetota bacterium]
IKLKKIQTLFKNGQRPVLDVTKADVNLADATLKYEKAKNFENMMKGELLSSIGILDENIEISPIDIKELPILRFSLNELYRLAEENSPLIKISKLKMEMDRVNISVERRAHIPRVDIAGGVGIENDEFLTRNKMEDNFKGGNWDSSTYIGMRAILSIYSGGGIQAKTDAAIADYNKSKYIQKKKINRMRSTISKFFKTMNELGKQIEISMLVIENSKKHLLLAQKSYENGIASHLDIQDAERMVLEAELSYLKARYDYLTTLAQLSHIVGLEEEYLCEK